MLALMLMAALAQAPEVVQAEPAATEQEAASVFLDVRHLQAGTPTPADGIWMDMDSAVYIARRARACDERLEQLQQAPPAWVPWVVGGVAVLAGGFVGYQVRRFSTR